MNKKLKTILKNNTESLVNSQKRLQDIYKIMFSGKDNLLCETNDGFRISKITYGEIEQKIEKAASGLYEKIGATHKYVGLALENSPSWIVAFWAILKSGNKPYLINLRYPSTLTENILKSLEIECIVCDKDYGFNATGILVDELNSSAEIPDDVFEDELAFSSSATSMNEVICFYSGYQISEQILNFKTIVKREPRMTKHYKGYLKQLAFLPFYHIFGLFAVYFWFTFFGRTLVFLRDYSSDTIIKTCRRHKVTHIFAVPMLWHTIEKKVIATAKEQGENQYKKLMRGIKFCTALQNILPSGWGAEISKSIMGQVTDKLLGKSIMFCINGGSYIKDSSLYLLNGIGYSTYNGYGMSEVGITSVELRRKPKYRNQNSIGMPFDSVEYKIEADGVLWIRGSSVCTKKRINGEEQSLNDWFCTGDNMTVKNGHYFILGRQGDLVIGENGENINPDSVEKLFDLTGCAGFSVLGLGNNEEQTLSIVVQLSKYTTEQKLEQIKSEVYSINNTLPKAMAIKGFFFTFDEISPPNAIKVSRTQLVKKIKEGTVIIKPFAEFNISAKDENYSPFAHDVKKIIAEVLQIDAEKVGDNAHIFNDLGATSIQYFDILTRLAKKFSVINYKETDKYAYTVLEICKYLEKRV